MFRAIFAHLQERKTVVYSNAVYCPNVVVGWRPGVWRRRLRRHTPGLHPTTTLGQYTALP